MEVIMLVTNGYAPITLYSSCVTKSFLIERDVVREVLNTIGWNFVIGIINVSRVCFPIEMLTSSLQTGCCSNRCVIASREERGTSFKWFGRYEVGVKVDNSTNSVRSIE